MNEKTSWRGSLRGQSDFLLHTPVPPCDRAGWADLQWFIDWTPMPQWTTGTRLQERSLNRKGSLPKLVELTQQMCSYNRPQRKAIVCPHPKRKVKNVLLWSQCLMTKWQITQWKRRGKKHLVSIWPGITWFYKISHWWATPQGSSRKRASLISWCHWSTGDR